MRQIIDWKDFFGDGLRFLIEFGAWSLDNGAINTNFLFFLHIDIRTIIPF